MSHLRKMYHFVSTLNYKHTNMITITQLPSSGVLYGNITEFGMAEDHLSPQVILCHSKLSDIATQHTRRRLFYVYAMIFI